jgi:hypothetical protein
MRIKNDVDKLYDTDLTDAAWSLIAPILPAARTGGRPRFTFLAKYGCFRWWVAAAKEAVTADGLVRLKVIKIDGLVEVPFLIFLDQNRCDALEGWRSTKNNIQLGE